MWDLLFIVSASALAPVLSQRGNLIYLRKLFMRYFPFILGVEYSYVEFCISDQSQGERGLTPPQVALDSWCLDVNELS